MNRKMTFLAVAGLCGGFGASGLGEPPGLPRRSSSARSSDASASEPKPQKASRRNSRRVRVRQLCKLISVHVQEGVQVEHGEGELLQRLRLEELDAERLLLRGRRPAGGEQVGVLDLAFRVGAGLTLQTLGERLRKLV